MYLGNTSPANLAVAAINIGVLIWLGKKFAWLFKDLFKENK